jgi:sulfite exporter TauE/SafE
MNGLEASVYSFLFGLLHGILPDEHTWPITFSYAMGGASGKQGMKAGFYFSSAFTVQRMLLSELSRLALAPFLTSESINAIVYVVVGILMSVAGAIVLKKNRYPHVHIAAHMEVGQERDGPIPSHSGGLSSPPPVHWALVHGFAAGFGFGGFSVFVNTVAAPAMANPWFGFLPGLCFGLGTMITIAAISAVFGASLKWTKRFNETEIKQIGTQTGGRTLFFGGILFSAAGIATMLGLDRLLPFDTGYVLITFFMLLIVIPAFVFSVRKVRAAAGRSPPC